MWYVTDMQSSRFQLLQLSYFDSLLRHVHEEGPRHTADDGSGHDGRSLAQWPRGDL